MLVDVEPPPNELGKYDCRYDGCDRVGASGYVRFKALQRHEESKHA